MLLEGSLFLRIDSKIDQRSWLRTTNLVSFLSMVIPGTINTGTPLWQASHTIPISLGILDWDSYGNSMGSLPIRGSHVLGGPWKSHRFYAMTPLLPGVRRRSTLGCHYCMASVALLTNWTAQQATRAFWGPKCGSNANEQLIKTAPGCLGFIGDAKTTQVYI